MARKKVKSDRVTADDIKNDSDADMNEKPETAGNSNDPTLWAASALNDLRLATAFLTRLPISANHNAGTAAFARAIWALPLVGGLIGAVGGGMIVLTAGSGLHPFAGTLLALAVMAVLTGALHEDGLADFADGLGATDRARRLEIMRDSRIGAFGVLALIFCVGLKASALMSLAGPGIALTTMIAAGAVSRVVAAPSLYMLPPARPDGLGHGAGAPPKWAVITSLGLGAMALLLLWPINGTGILAIGGAGLAAALFMTWVMHKTLGGQTGDALGAQQQITETAIYLAAASAEVVL